MLYDEGYPAHLLSDHYAVFVFELIQIPFLTVILLLFSVTCSRKPHPPPPSSMTTARAQEDSIQEFIPASTSASFIKESAERSRKTQPTPKRSAEESRNTRKSARNNGSSDELRPRNTQKSRSGSMEQSRSSKQLASTRRSSMESARPRKRMSSADGNECKTQLTENRKTRSSSKRVSSREKASHKTVNTQRDDTTVESRKRRNRMKTSAEDPTMNSTISQSIKAVVDLKQPTQEDEIVTVEKLDEEPTIKQTPANQYEKTAAQKRMVIDPNLVTKRGNIDNMYTKVKSQFIGQLRETELPSDREDRPAPTRNKEAAITGLITV
ncbi:hypothetical protein Q1695_014629 [Nippostrongylus brasiliensis]|nr:hypothetical protein Q1695_014629 [Nippostrongylus brasiliensis]